MLVTFDVSHLVIFPLKVFLSLNAEAMLVTSDVFQFAIGPKMLFVHSPCTGDKARHTEIAYLKSSSTVEPRPEVCPLMLALSAKVALLQTGSVRTPKEHEYPL
jgi:hypothetical protein